MPAPGEHKTVQARINLVKAIEKAAEENSDDPFLVALAERAKVVQEGFENRQTSTAEALAALVKEIEKNEQRKKDQAAKGMDGLPTSFCASSPMTASRIPKSRVARLPRRSARIRIGSAARPSCGKCGSR
jgi:hypothetical protein